MLQRNVGLLTVSCEFGLSRAIAALPPRHAVQNYLWNPVTMSYALYVEGTMMPSYDPLLHPTPQPVRLLCHEAMTDSRRTLACSWAHSPGITWEVDRSAVSPPLTLLGSTMNDTTCAIDAVQPLAPGDKGEGSAAHPVEQRTDVQKHVDAVVGDLIARDVDARDRARLGKALDTANAPEQGRPGSDKAIGRITQSLR